MKKNLLKDTIADLEKYINRSSSDFKHRIKHFMKRYNNEFPIKSKIKERAIAESMIYILFRRSLFLYCFDLKGACVIDIHSLVERLLIEHVVRKVFKKEDDISLKLVEKNSLPEIARMLEKLELLGKESVKYSEKLNRIRNAIAHRNPNIISKLFLGGKKITSLDIDSAVDKVDCISLLFGAIYLIMDLANNLQINK